MSTQPKTGEGDRQPDPRGVPRAPKPVQYERATRGPQANVLLHFRRVAHDLVAIVGANCLDQ